MKPTDAQDATEPLADRAVADAERVRLGLAVRAAIALVRVYRAEEGPAGEREVACLAEVARLREVLSTRRRARLARAVPIAGPGLAKTDEERALERSSKPSKLG